MSRLAIALLLSVGVHVAALGLIELVAAPPHSGGGAVSKESGLRVSLGTHPPLNILGQTAPNPPSVSEKQGDHGAPDIWPEMFIPIVQGDDGRDAYLSAGEVDRRPAPESAIVVPFPKDGVLYTEKGEVVLLLFIGANGRVDDVKVESANVSLPFQRSALEAFRSAKMIPGIKNGVSVSVKMRVVVEFEESSIN